MADINRVQYIGQDFDTIRQEILTYLQSKYPDDYNDYVASNLGTALIDQLAWTMQGLSWYLNRKTSDHYFPTASTPNSISKVARWLGYKPGGAEAARVSLTVALQDGPYTFPVRIPRFFQFKGPNRLVFEYRGVNPIVYSPGETTKTFDVYEGSTQFKTFVSTGDLNQTFNLLGVPVDKYVEDGSVAVTIDNASWVESPVIPFSATESFETNLLSTPPVLVFGDGVQGLIPTADSVINVSFAVTSGFRGRILSGTIREPVQTLVANFENIPLTITQAAASFGGDDPESLSSIVSSAPLFQRSQDRAITKGDYDFLSNAYPNVAKADAMILRGITGDVVLQTFSSSIRMQLDTVDGFIDGLSGYTDVDALVAGVTGDLSSASGFVSGVSVVAAAVSGVVSFGTGSIASSQQAASANMGVVVPNLASLETGRQDILLNLDQMYFLTTGTPLSSSGYVAVSALQPYLAAVNNNLTVMAVQIAQSQTSAVSITGALASLSGQNANVSGVIGSVTGLVNLPVFQASTEAEISQAVTGCVAIAAAASDIRSLYAITGYTLGASGDLQSILDYLDETYADGCKANTVQVSVLAEDANRRYVSPSNFLLEDLKTYLSVRKDAVHSLSVVSGTAFVIDANVLVECKVSPNAVRDDVINAVEDAVMKSDVEPYGLLVKRVYNKSLFNSEIYNRIRAAVEERELPEFNVVIQGPAQFLDGRGNLICPDGFVIQAGTIVVRSI
jgi:hypothetical protein